MNARFCGVFMFDYDLIIIIIIITINNNNNNNNNNNDDNDNDNNNKKGLYKSQKLFHNSNFVLCLVTNHRRIRQLCLTINASLFLMELLNI